MAVLVTGANSRKGAGFLGQHLVRLLLKQGRPVVVFDSLWTGSRDAGLNLENEGDFRFFECDVKDPLPQVEDIEEIYHLACPASPDHFDTNPIEILETCYAGTKNVLELAVRIKARVLIASTSEIYGDPLVDVQSETYWGNVNSFGPRSCYDEGKRVAEALAFAYRAKHGVQVRVARIFNAYGPYMKSNDGRAVPNFITAAMEGKPITIYGDGSATRCFQFATDCIEGLVALMKSAHDGPVNIGSDDEIPISQVATMIANAVAAKMGRNWTVPILFLPRRTDDPIKRKPDITLARKALGWAPKVSLQHGIAATTEWFMQKNKDVLTDTRLGPVVQHSNQYTALRPTLVEGK